MHTKVVAVRERWRGRTHTATLLYFDAVESDSQGATTVRRDVTGQGMHRW